MTRRLSEPHRVSKPYLARTLRVRTNDRITHAAWPEWWPEGRPIGVNDARTACDLRVHHCDLRGCRHGDRHRARLFSARVADDALVDCMTCLTRQARQEN